MKLTLVSDGHLYQHCRKYFNFQDMGIADIYILPPFRLSSQSYVTSSLMFRAWQKLLFSTLYLYNPLPEHKGWETHGGSMHFLPQFSNLPHPLPVEHEAVSPWVCRMKQMAAMWQDLGKESSCLKQLLIPHLFLLHDNLQSWK